jgi:hypothetical protein
VAIEVTLVQSTETVPMVANALVSSPPPLGPSSEAVRIMVATVQDPPPSDILEVAIEVTLVQPLLPIQMSANALVSASPHPFCATSETVGILVATGQVPVCADKLPPAMEVTLVQRAVTELMSANALVSSPPPLGLSSEAVPVMVAAVQVPLATNINPVGTSPALQATVAVLVSALSFQTAPEITRLAVVCVATVQPPFSTNAAPTTLVVAVEGLISISMHTDALVGIGPSPLEAPMQVVIVSIAAEQCPPPSDVVIAVATPSVQHALPVEMTANALSPSTPFHQVASV